MHVALAAGFIMQSLLLNPSCHACTSHNL